MKELLKKEINLQSRMRKFSRKNGWKEEYLKDKNKDIYYIAYNSKTTTLAVRKLELDFDRYYSEIYNCVNFASKEATLKAISIFGDELKEIYKLKKDIIPEINEYTKYRIGK